IVPKVGRRRGRAAVSNHGYALDQITRFLSFNREKECRQDSDALALEALLIGAAGSNLIRPKGKASLVRLAIEEIKIVLTHKKARCIYGVRPISHIVVRDSYSGCRWHSEKGAGRIAEGNREILVTFLV